MGGAAMGDGDEAVSVNVTPLIDIIFCLCIFFICSFHFKQLQGKLDSWLPKTGGVHQGPAEVPYQEEVRIFVRTSGGATQLAFGSRELGAFSESRERDQALVAELAALAKAQRDDVLASGKKCVIIVDGEPGVPWKHVVSVLDAFKAAGVNDLEFAQPMPKPGAR